MKINIIIFWDVDWQTEKNVLEGSAAVMSFNLEDVGGNFYKMSVLDYQTT